MKVKFANYTYWDKNSEDKKEYNGIGNAAYDKYKFDEKYFDKLISNRQYLDAADYASHFVFTGQAQIDHENDIINLRRNGQALNAVYGKISDSDPSGKALDKVSFYDNVFVDGGLETLKNNKYAAEFVKNKRLLGSEIDPRSGKILNEATALSIEFQPEKAYLFGIDWLARDNPNTADNFYKKLGVTEQQLKNASVNISHPDGKTILKFDKTNKFANLILATLGDQNLDLSLPLGSELAKIKSYDRNGNEITPDKGYQKQIGHATSVNIAPAARNIQKLVNDASSFKQEYFKKLDLENKQYSSAATTWISDELQALKEQSATEDEFNRKAKLIAPQIYNALNSLGSSNYEFYSNINNEDGDETLIPIADSKTRNELIGRITSTAPSKYQVDAMTSNGKVGALVTLYERRDNKGNLLYPRVQVFISGLLQEQAQAKLNRDTNIRAIQELNSMLDWGYNYKLDNGSEISITNDGGFAKDGKPITKEQAIRDLNRNFILQDVETNLKYNFINAKGELLNEDKYEANARAISVKAAADLYKGALRGASYDGSVISINGNTYSVSDIFNDDIIVDNVPFRDWEIIQDIVSMYNSIMDDLTYYKK